MKTKNMNKVLAKKDEPKKLEVRKFKKSLKCIFTEPEILQLGKQLAEKTELASQIEANKKQVVKQFDADIAEAEAQIQSASSKIQSGYEYRQIECAETLGDPTDMQKTVRRLDSNAVVEVVALTPEEMQRKLKFEEEQKPVIEPV